jgi:glycerophosphoryl diester phosphodiesterase
MKSQRPSIIAPVLPQIHGHRGCRGLLPENTLPAFARAVALGVAALEMDVVLSADGQVVVSHEPWLTARCHDAQGFPVAAGTELQHNLYRMPYSLIRECDCGLIAHPGFPQQQRLPAYKPLLREVIEATEIQTRKLGQSAMLYSVEIKSTPGTDQVFHPGPEEFVTQVLAVLQATNVQERTTVLSFDQRILRALRQQDSAQALCLLVEDSIPYTTHLNSLGFLPTVYGPQFTLVTGPMVADLHQKGISVVPWTVNTVADAVRLQHMGVNGLTTDYPDVLLSFLKPV